jgi:hypothetical protein
MYLNDTQRILYKRRVQEAILKAKLAQLRADRLTTEFSSKYGGELSSDDDYDDEDEDDNETTDTE